jgi:integrase
MANRTTYRDYGLVFAKDPSTNRHRRPRSGTSITLALGANVPVHVVAKRAGHAKAEMTLSVYAHVLKDQQKDAAAKLGAVPVGKSELRYESLVTHI